MKWQDHIVSDKQVLLGKPTIKGTRISVELILELFESGWNEKQILESLFLLLLLFSLLSDIKVKLDVTRRLPIKSLILCQLQLFSFLSLEP